MKRVKITTIIDMAKAKLPGAWPEAVRNHCNKLREEREAARRLEEEDRRKAFIEAARIGDLTVLERLLEDAGASRTETPCDDPSP